MAFVPGISVSSQLSIGTRPSTCRRLFPRMALGVHVGNDTSADDYVTIGVAKYFRRVETKLEEVLLLEPLPNSAFECVMELKVPTSYMRIWATRLGDVPDTIEELPEGMVLDGEVVRFGDDFSERCQASARTFRRSESAHKLLQPGSITTGINHSIATKRMLDEDWEPDFSDNVKQDMSIDVYDRSVDESATAIKSLYNA